MKKSPLLLGFIFSIAVTSLWAAGQEVLVSDFKIAVDGTAYNVISALPTSGGEKHPLVIYLHGGSRGDLGKVELRKLAKVFAEEGFIFWAPERETGGTLKGAVNIARKAIETALTDPHVDQANVAMVGFSQGAKAAFLVGLPAGGLKAICLLGFGDLLRSSGHSKSTLENLREMDLMRVRVKTLIMIAENDGVVDIDDSRLLATALEWAGKPIKVISYPGYRHEDLCGKDKYLGDLKRFLKESLR